MSKRYQLVYLSRLAPTELPTCVAGIVHVARLLNEIHKVSSLLIFDGGRFCQYLEGRHAEVISLAERIRADVRHIDFKLLYQAEFDGLPLLPGCGLEYALSYEYNLDHFETVSGPGVIDLLRNVLPTLDREP